MINGCFLEFSASDKIKPQTNVQVKIIQTKERTNEFDANKHWNVRIDVS